MVCLTGRIHSMAEQTPSKLNQLGRKLPEGLVVDALWMSDHGYSTSLRSQYVASGWLDQPTRRVYRRPRGVLSWQQVVISLQTLLQRTLVVGGRTALELHGYAHFLRVSQPTVHLHGPEKPPTWLADLQLDATFRYHNSVPLFGGDLVGVELPGLAQAALSPAKQAKLRHAELRVLPWGQWDWPMSVSTPERAVLELLDEVPARETFHQADMLMESIGDLSPARLQTLLERCRRVKTKRLFFYFAERHEHPWLKHLNRDRVDLGAGKRVLVRDGHLDPTYEITVPRDMMDRQRA